MNNGSQNAYLTRIATEQVNEQSARLDSINGQQIAALMNQMDAQVSAAVAEAVEPIGLAIEEIAKRLQRSGRLFYIGAGTSGRLGVLDASECPPTLGVTPDMIQGIIAGGDRALRHALEGAEDDAVVGVVEDGEFDAFVGEDVDLAAAGLGGDVLAAAFGDGARHA